MLPSSSPDEIVARSISEIREKSGWTAQEFADRVNESLDAKAAWSRWVVLDVERRRDPNRIRCLSPSELVAVARALRVSVLELLLPTKGSVRLGEYIVSHSDYAVTAFHLPPYFSSYLPNLWKSAVEQTAELIAADIQRRTGRDLTEDLEGFEELKQFIAKHLKGDD